jgi:hypothetical protein
MGYLKINVLEIVDPRPADDDAVYRHGIKDPPPSTTLLERKNADAESSIITCS